MEVQDLPPRRELEIYCCSLVAGHHRNIFSFIFLFFSKRRQMTQMRTEALSTLYPSNRQNLLLRRQNRQPTTRPGNRRNPAVRSRKLLRHPGSSILCTRPARRCNSSRISPAFLLLPVLHQRRSLMTPREKVIAEERLGTECARDLANI